MQSNLREFAENSNINIINSGNLDIDISKPYICDLLSHVMSNAEENVLWITVQNNANIIAVSSLLNIPAILLVEGVKINPDVLGAAVKENITILETDLSAFDSLKIFLNGDK